VDDRYLINLNSNDIGKELKRKIDDQDQLNPVAFRAIEKRGFAK
jgi:hypothetical protein